MKKGTPPKTLKIRHALSLRWLWEVAVDGGVSTSRTIGRLLSEPILRSKDTSQSLNICNLTKYISGYNTIYNIIYRHICNAWWRSPTTSACSANGWRVSGSRPSSLPRPPPASPLARARAVQETLE